MRFTLLTDNTINYAAGFGVLVCALAAIALVEVARRSTADAPAIARVDSPMLHGTVATAK